MSTGDKFYTKVVPGWAPVTYAENDIIKEGDFQYECNTAGLQITSFAVNSALWDLYTPAVIRIWVDGKTYAVGDQLVEAGRLLTCNFAGVQNTSYSANAARWDSVARPNRKLTPGSDALFDLGDTAMRWRNAYLETGIQGSSSFAIDDSTGERIGYDATSTDLLSPDGLSTLKVSNTNIAVTGDLTVGTDLTVDNDLTVSGDLITTALNSQHPMTCPDTLVKTKVLNGSATSSFPVAHGILNGMKHILSIQASIQAESLASWWPIGGSTSGNQVGMYFNDTNVVLYNMGTAINATTLRWRVVIQYTATDMGST
jgi:hypothetical protein